MTVNFSFLFIYIDSASVGFNKEVGPNRKPLLQPNLFSMIMWSHVELFSEHKMALLMTQVLLECTPQKASITLKEHHQFRTKTAYIL